MKCIVDDDVVLSRPLEGPLSAHIAAFAQWARDQGYARASRYRQVLLAACFSRWLGQQTITVRHVAAAHAARYLRSRARRVQIHRGDRAALRQFLDFLRRRGVVRAKKISPPHPTPIEQAVQAFAQYLRGERALVRATVVNYVPFIRRFLMDRFGGDPVRLSRLQARDVMRFVQRQAPRLHLKTAKLLTTALRSFLRYARYRGAVTQDLAAAVATVANWSMSSIPRAIPAESVRRLLASIDRRTARGRRDYAILLLLARLGLRGSEVALLELDDLDWNAGQITIRGKRGRIIALPLPADAGAAIAAYLRHGRPRSTSRRVFLRAHAPSGGFAGPSAIACIVRHGLEQAGLPAPTKGAHQFRHALATQMLHDGASLTEIGEILGHRSPETTMIYAKVDLDALRTLALPWPGGAR
ncbi:MAG: integrase [Acidobacteria bacterium RIFCSPLOWO2_02_FULL_68_18]|nr:MAG: integrase [Acidobacteria bacterium RIFCSPLOWO2_02_FULL_68_18]OFW49682.1 MAG: integrase [Acidobacteria bacterium RIFCSPLOWO2_12_FULL_68_19]